MILIDIPSWMIMIGWFFTQIFKVVTTMFILVMSLNKIDVWRNK
jgi:hypothetical protein|tara:strand:- start:202 stop:333 length:132 start_codon:yes stop_codon:yes gene_type:complete